MSDLRVILLDGYTDEPSIFGVPPYISPYVRYAYGALKEAGAEVRYYTIDQVRKDPSLINWAEILAIHRGVIVPGKYLGGSPITFSELKALSENFKGTVVLGGSAAKYGFGGIGGRAPIPPEKVREVVDFAVELDFDAFLYDLVKYGKGDDRYRTREEWRRWAVKGAELVRMHPWFPYVISEIETYQGCHRFLSGGCSFCMEPLREIRVRDQEEIHEELKALHSFGENYVRIGGQPCFYSYKAIGFGETEEIIPNVEEVKRLILAVRKAGNFKVIHIDNGNPKVIAENEKESREITKLLVKYFTDGNVVAFGMESADPEVISRNNLNSTPEEVMKAIEIINEVGRLRGPTGLPWILPGINLLYGLLGESKRTYELNYLFLKEVLSRGLMLRRINIREVVPIRRKFKKIDKKLFHHWKEKIRREIDLPMLRRIVPKGTILRGVLMEKREGNYTIGRQLGSYPIRVVVPYPLDLWKFYSIKVIDHGYRSVTGLRYPIDPNKSPMKELECVPGIGKKRAARIILERPIDRKRLLEIVPPESLEYFGDLK